MSDRLMARRAAVKVVFDGTDISKDLEEYMLSLSYTDSDEDEGDSLQISMQDREGVWKQQWLEQSVRESGKSMTIQAVIARRNWNSNGGDDILECGAFELDSVSAQGPPSTVTVKGISVPYNSTIRQTQYSRSWEAYDLKKIAGEIAGRAGMGLMYLPKPVPAYDRVEQYRTSDIVFLKKLCQDAGFSVKVSNKILIIFDQWEYEQNGPVRTFKYGDGTVIKYKCYTNETQTYALCHVYYDNDGTLIEWTQKAEDYDPKNNANQKLEVNQKVGTVDEAKALAKQMLRLYNKFAYEIDFTVPGDTCLVAGATVMLSGYGMFDGKYLIKTATHTVSGSGGYTTKIKGQRALTE